MFPSDTQILVVDDSMNIRQIICDNLRQLGFTKIEAAGDANEGYQREEKHDVEQPLHFNISFQAAKKDPQSIASESGSSGVWNRTHDCHNLAR